MLGDVRKQAEIRFKRIEDSLGVFRDVIDRARKGQTPDGVELSGLAFMLQTSYTDVEAIFKLVAQQIDGRVPDSDSWHRDLLISMKDATSIRPAVISTVLHGRLRDYLNYAHFSRHATAAVLDWEQMRDLVLNAEETFKSVQSEVTDFLDHAASP